MEEGKLDSPATQTEPKPIWPPLPKKSDEAASRPAGRAVAERRDGSHAAAPETVQDIGLSPSFLVELVLKVIHYAETPTAEHVARVVGLPTRHVIELLDALKSERFCEIIGGSTYDLSSTYRFRLTETGKKRAEEALERCRYAGAAPVTVGQYERVISGLGANPRPTTEAIREALSSLILDPTAATYLERAFHSCRSTMVFGPSGNGKTHVITEFIKHLGGEVLVPYAIYAYGQIIRIYDPLNHHQIRDEIGGTRRGRRAAVPISARPDSIGQGRVLRLLRDEGSRSRAELGELAGLTRSRLEAELTRLMQLGLVQEAGKAASRGGRRSTLVELSPFLHFGGVDLGASSMRVAVMTAELEIKAQVAEPRGSPPRPGAGSGPRHRDDREAGPRPRGPAGRDRRRRSRSGPLP